MSNENTAATYASQPSTPQPVGDDLHSRKLELAALERPLFNRPSFCIQAAVATVALAGVVGCAQLSREHAITNDLLKLVEHDEKQLADLNRRIFWLQYYNDRYIIYRWEHRLLSHMRKEEYRLLLAQIKKLQSEGAIEPDASAKLSRELTESVRRRVRNLVAAMLGFPPEIKDEQSISFANDLDADSLKCVELIMDFEDEFEIQIPDEDTDSLNTVGDVVRYLSARLPGEPAENVHRRVISIVTESFIIFRTGLKDEHFLRDDLDASIRRIIWECEDVFEINIPDDDIKTFNTVGDIVNYVATKLQAP